MTSDARVKAFKNFNINFLHWNINGVENKFSSEFVAKLIEDIDILIINETHFNIRSKCPEKFYLIGKSKPIQANKARGGVAIYRSFACNVRLQVIDMDFPDCVIAEICDSNVIIAAFYITPDNSKYYSKEYFDNLQSFLEMYADYRDIILIGDFNARAADTSDTLNHKNYTYCPNPDIGSNHSGKVLKKIISKYENVCLVNGLTINNKQFSNEFTFHRGRQASRNDLCFSNNTQLITDFQVLDKCPLSDHCPVKLQMNVNIDLWMSLLPECVTGLNNYDHYDKSKRMKPKIRANKCNIGAMIYDLEKLGEEINEKYPEPPDEESVDLMCNEVTTKIYEVIKRNKRKPDEQIPEPRQKNCTSKNFYAIAEMQVYQYHRLKDIEPEKAKKYRDEWCYYLEVALKTEEEELKVKKERSWRIMYKNDSKALWKQIEWKERNHDEKKTIPPKIINQFFTNIFQSPSLDTVPKIETVYDKVMTYSTQHDDMDKDITDDEIDLALVKIGKGTSMDGISPDIISIIPPQLRISLRRLFNGIFHHAYPFLWIKQLLMPTPKKGHTIMDPKLRGVAMGQILSRLYDIIVTKRFLLWYKPNKQQAGFRELQGCIIQIFCLMLLADYSRIMGTGFFVGLFDYEKAFDYLCRPLLLEELMNDGAGNKFVKCLYNIYKNTSYVPQTTNEQMGEEIYTSYGVTQGRSSSANLFSYYISDMIKNVEDPHVQDLYMLFCLLQLADDTTIFAENSDTFRERAHKISIYSDYKYKFMRINVPKTKYLNMGNTEDRCRKDIIVNEKLCIEAVKDQDGYNWLGFWLSHTNKILELIQFNVKKKMYNIAKFYEWLKVNNETPFQVKIDVLYSCLFMSILYSCEAWGNLTRIEEQFNLIERKALKAILGIKQGTSEEIMYAEINRPEISAVIKDRQFKFWAKFQSLSIEDAIARTVLDFYWENCNNEDNLINYYNSLKENHKDTNMNMIRQRINNSQSSMCIRYKMVIGIPESPLFLYVSLTNEKDRQLITRWRMSSHPLFIETGRRKNPKIPRAERVCIICNVLEDETHAIFHCKAHDFIRVPFAEYLHENNSVINVLNPQSHGDVKMTADFLRKIEKNMDQLGMVQ